MACQTLCKQGRDDIVVKVVYKASSLHRFHVSLKLYCIKDVGIGLCKFTFTTISSLPCLHNFWHVIPASFYIFNVFFKSCFCIFLLISVTVRPKA